MSKQTKQGLCKQLSGKTGCLRAASTLEINHQPGIGIEPKLKQKRRILKKEYFALARDRKNRYYPINFYGEHVFPPKTRRKIRRKAPPCLRRKVWVISLKP